MATFATNAYRVQLSDLRIGADVRVLLAFGVFSLLARATALPHSVAGPDESLYFVQAQRWLHGAWPYSTGVWDIHPAGAPALLAIAFGLLGEAIWVARLLASLSVAVTAYLLHRLLVLSGAGRDAGVAAGLLYIAFTLKLGGLATNTEVLFAPFATAAALVIYAAHPAGEAGRGRAGAGCRDGRTARRRGDLDQVRGRHRGGGRLLRPRRRWLAAPAGGLRRRLRLGRRLRRRVLDPHRRHGARLRPAGGTRGFRLRQFRRAAPLRRQPGHGCRPRPRHRPRAVLLRRARRPGRVRGLVEHVAPVGLARAATRPAGARRGVVRRGGRGRRIHREVLQPSLPRAPAGAFRGVGPRLGAGGRTACGSRHAWRGGGRRRHAPGRRPGGGGIWRTARSAASASGWTTPSAGWRRPCAATSPPGKRSGS